jgi:hypothetical protein
MVSYWLLLGMIAGINGPTLDPHFGKFPTLEACQLQAEAAKEMGTTNELLGCLHVDQVTRFYTVPGTWK